MKEILSLFVTVICCIVCGYIAIWEKKQKKNLIQGLGCGIDIFVIINLYRLFILAGDIAFVYNKVGYVIVDIVIAVTTTIFVRWYNVYVFKYLQNQRYRLIQLISLALVELLSLIYMYKKTDNVKTAIYEMICPKYIVLLFLVSTLISWGVYIVLKKKNCKNNHTFMWKNQIYEAKEIICMYLVTIWIYPMIETLLVNKSGWTFSVGGFLHSAILLYFVIAAAITLFLAFADKIIWRYVICLLFAYSLMSYIQIMLLNHHIFMMDGKNVTWDRKVVVVNIMMWGIVFSITLFIVHKWKTKSIKAFRYIALAITVMQLAGMVSLCINSKINDEPSPLDSAYLSKENLYEVAQKENIIYFILDVFDVDCMNKVLESDSEFLKPLDGFVYYPDTVAQYPRTIPSITYILTQKGYLHDRKFKEYVEEAHNNTHFLQDIKNKGYKYYLYSENEYFSDTVKVNAGNYIERGFSQKDIFSWYGCLTTLLKVGHYRGTPYYWKNNYVYTQEDINLDVIKQHILEHPRYEWDDAEVYKNINDTGLKISDDEKAFRFIHLMGAHNPYTLDENANRVDKSKTSELQQCKGTWQIVFKYIEELKRLGLYDQATIIVSADHGENFMTKELEENTNPILFIKYSGQTGTELTVSDAKVSQEDILCTLAHIVNIETEMMGYNLENEELIPMDRKRYHYYTVVDNTVQIGAVTYEIEGNSLDFSNWKKTDEFVEFTN